VGVINKIVRMTEVGMPSIWFQVSDANGNNVGSVAKVDVKLRRDVKLRDVNDLCKAIKVEMDPDLNHCSAARLSVYPAGTAFENCNTTNALDRGDEPPEGTTSKAPLVVIAPKDPQGVWWLSFRFRSLTL
jgi:hypothetical protein